MWFISIHPLVKVGMTREKIGDGIILTRDMGEVIVEILEVFDPMGLLARDFMGLMEVLEVFVVSMDLNRISSAKEEGSSHLEAKEDCSKFFVISIIIAFCREKTSAIKANGINTIVKSLSNNCSKGIARCISLKDKLF